MRRVLPFVLLPLCLVRAREVWVPAPAQLLPAFREKEVASGKIVREWSFGQDVGDWRPRSATVSVTHVPGTGHEAAGCLRIHGHEEQGWNFAWSPDMAVEPGASYRVGLWLRIEAAGLEPAALHYFKVQMYNRGRPGGAQVTSQRLPVQVTGRWEHLTASFTVPADGMGRIAIALEKGTREKRTVDVLVDDVVVERMPDDAVERVWRDARLRGPITAELRGVHPRLYLTPDRLSYLRRAVRSDPWWQKQLATLCGHADRAVLSGPPDYARNMAGILAGKPVSSREQLWQREVGNRLPQVALAYLLTGEEDYLVACKRWTFAAIDYPSWGAGSLAGIDLAAGHMLGGIGLAYDWLHEEFTAEERERIRRTVVPRAEAMGRAGFEKRAPWHGSYLQNHQWVSLGGLATAGFAMADEVPEAASWICLAHAKFVRTLQELGDDGASHEGYGYWEYGAEYIMRYMELAKECLGIDLYVDGQGRPHPWLSRNAAYALYLALPRDTWSPKQSVVDLADCPRNHWYGPSHLLHNLARKYPQSEWSGTAQWLAEEALAAGVDAGGGSHFLNFVWRDDAVPSRSPEADQLPLLHHFQDLGIVSARSRWAGGATQLVVKCGPPLGHSQEGSTTDYGAGHVHPDAGHFVLASGGEMLFRDSGYTHHKASGNHSTLLVNGKGQKGEGGKWFRYADWVREPQVPRIRAAETDGEADVILCEVAPAYPAGLGLEQYDRAFRYDRNRTLAIEDTVRVAAPAELEWRFHVEGDLRQVAAGEWATTQANVSATIRLSATVPIVCAPQSLTVNEHIRSREATYLAVRSREKVSAAVLRTMIEIGPAR